MGTIFGGKDNKNQSNHLNLKQMSSNLFGLTQSIVRVAEGTFQEKIYSDGVAASLDPMRNPLLMQSQIKA